MPKRKLNCRDRSDRMQFVMKTRQNNDVTNCTRMVYAENEIELSRSIKKGVDNDKIQLGQ